MSNPNTGVGLVARLAAQYGVDKDKFINTLNTTIFAQHFGNEVYPPSPEELMTLLVVCDQYGLNPFTRQIFAFKAKTGLLVPVVSIDGWLAIINRQPSFDGVKVRFSEKEVEISDVRMPEYCECEIRRKGIAEPIVIPEYAQECFMPSSPVWSKYPRRMLRHKAVIQCARVAFGLSGIYDQDEADKIMDIEGVATPKASVVDPKASLKVVAPKTIKEKPKEKPREAPLSLAPNDSLDVGSLDKILESAVSMAKIHHNWQMAKSWVHEEFAGAELQYAQRYLAKRRLEIEAEALEEAQVSQVSAVPNATTSASTTDEEVPPPPPPAMTDDEAEGL